MMSFSTEDHHTKSRKKKHRPLKLVLDKFAGETTAHGIPRVIDRPRFLSKIFWLTIVVVAFAIFVYQTIDLLKHYYDFNTKVNLINSQEVVFPAITVCNLNRMKRNLLVTNERWDKAILEDMSNNHYGSELPWKQDESAEISDEMTDWPESEFNTDYFGSAPPPWPGMNPPTSPSLNRSDHPTSDVPPGERSKRGLANDDYQWSYDSFEEGEPDYVSPTMLNPDVAQPDVSSSYSSSEENESDYVSSTMLNPDVAQSDVSSSNDTFEEIELDKDFPSSSIPGTQGLDLSGPATDTIWQADDIDIPDPTREELRDMGHQAEDFILDCRFNSRKCDHRDFTVTQRKHYGNCFTFNGDTTNSTSPIRITKAGSYFGLHLTMFIEHDEYVGFLSEEAGVRVMAHQRDIMPHPEDVGMSVPPGISTNLALRQVVINRLPQPYGNCTTGAGLPHLHSDQYSYNIISCQKKCLLDTLAAECGCVTSIYDDYDDLPQCNRTQRVCRQSVERGYYQNDLGCYCPASCEELVYNVQSSASSWPSESSFFYRRSDLGKARQDVHMTLSDLQAARKNLVRVKIYFQELNYELVEQVPAHSFASVLGTIGGLLGLYIGFSLITVSEILVLIFDLIVALIFKKDTGNRTVVN